MNITDIYRIFYPTVTEYTFLSSTHGIFSWVDHMLNHKTILNKFTKIEIITSIMYRDSATQQKKNKQPSKNWCDRKKYFTHKKDTQMAKGKDP